MSIQSITTDHRKRSVSKMEMHNPVHPGEIVREECLKPLNVTVTGRS